MRSTWLALVCALVLSACASIEQPGRSCGVSPPVPASISTTAVDDALPLPSGSALVWQNVIVDPALKAAVELALLNNRDLRVAALNIDATRAQYGIRVADAGPTLNIGATATAGTTRGATAYLGYRLVGA